MSKKILFGYFILCEYLAKIGLVTTFIAISKPNGFFILLGVDLLYSLALGL